MWTEEEAKQKSCSFTRLTGAGDSSGQEWHTNRPSYHEVSDKNFDTCIGSACMAWRWAEYHDPRERALFNKATGERVTRGLSSETEWRVLNPDEPAPPKKGYCGLAGEPK